MSATSIVSTNRQPRRRGDRAGIGLLLAGAVAAAGVVLWSGIGRLAEQLSTGTWRGELVVGGALPAAADRGPAALLAGHYETAAVTVGVLGPLAFGLLTTGLVLFVVTAATVVVAFAYLGVRLLLEKPFRRSLTVAFSVAGVALVVGSMLGAGFDSAGSMLVIAELGSPGAAGDFWPMAVRGNAAPIGIGFALLIVAHAFEHGERLSRETDGLV